MKGEGNSIADVRLNDGIGEGDIGRGDEVAVTGRTSAGEAALGGTGRAASIVTISVVVITSLHSWCDDAVSAFTHTDVPTQVVSDGQVADRTDR